MSIVGSLRTSLELRRSRFILIIPSEILNREIFGTKNLCKGRLSSKISLQKKFLIFGPPASGSGFGSESESIDHSESGGSNPDPNFCKKWSICLQLLENCDFVLRHKCWVTWHPPSLHRLAMRCRKYFCVARPSSVDNHVFLLLMKSF